MQNFYELSSAAQTAAYQLSELSNYVSEAAKMADSVRMVSNQMKSIYQTAEWNNMAYRTVTEWERGTRKMPDYVCQSINYPISPRIWLVRPEQISISPIRFRRSTDRQWKVPLSGYRQKC